MTAQESWRDRFVKLTNEHDESQRRFGDAAQLLTRTIARVCIATAGLDTRLDPPLQRLRSATRKGFTPQLESDLVGFVDDLVAASEAVSRQDLIAQVVAHQGLDRRQAKSARELWLQLAAQTKALSEKQLDDLVQALGLNAQSQPTPKANKGFSRLFSRSQTPQPNVQLVSLLAKIPWPESLQREVHTLQEALAGEQGAPDAWVEIVERIGAMAIDATVTAQREAESAESFLAGLTARLQALDDHMRGEGTRRVEARNRADRLGDMMRTEVGDLSDSVKSGISLSDLRQAVLSGLDRIQVQVQGHLTEEEDLRRGAEARERELMQLLEDTERQSFELRRELASQREQALIDPLTALPNRRAYDLRVAQEHARWRRFQEPLSLIVWDIDDFKQVNDQFGHKAGDRALQLVAKTLRKRLRQTDFIARYGGEELVVLLIGTGSNECVPVVEQMRLAVASAGLHCNKEPVPLTVSGGLTEFRPGDTLESVFERADQAMYEAKSAGKNRYVVA